MYRLTTKHLSRSFLSSLYLCDHEDVTQTYTRFRVWNSVSIRHWTLAHRILLALTSSPIYVWDSSLILQMYHFTLHTDDMDKANLYLIQIVRASGFFCVFTLYHKTKPPPRATHTPVDSIMMMIVVGKRHAQSFKFYLGARLLFACYSI